MNSKQRDEIGFDLLAVLKAHIHEHGFDSALKSSPYVYCLADGGMVLALISQDGIITLFDLEINRLKSMTFEELLRKTLPKERVKRNKLLKELATAIDTHRQGLINVEQAARDLFAEQYEEMVDIILGSVPEDDDCDY